jgi:hypothetical protein
MKEKYICLLPYNEIIHNNQYTIFPSLLPRFPGSLTIQCVKWLSELSQNSSVIKHTLQLMLYSNLITSLGKSALQPCKAESIPFLTWHQHFLFTVLFILRYSNHSCSQIICVYWLIYLNITLLLWWYSFYYTCFAYFQTHGCMFCYRKLWNINFVIKYTLYPEKNKTKKKQ